MCFFLSTRFLNGTKSFDLPNKGILYVRFEILRTKNGTTFFLSVFYEGSTEANQLCKKVVPFFDRRISNLTSGIPLDGKSKLLVPFGNLVVPFGSLVMPFEESENRSRSFRDQSAVQLCYGLSDQDRFAPSKDTFPVNESEAEFLLPPVR